MKNKYLLRGAACFAAISMLFSSCDDELSEIGSSLSTGEVTIEVDSTFLLNGHPVYTPEIDSRSTTNLLGRISIPEYGSLSCSYVSRLISASNFPLSDTIQAEQIDSLRLILSAVRSSVTGDTLAPQQLKVYQLTKQLPSDISSKFNPEGYYDPSSPLGVRNYTMTLLGYNDTTFRQASYIPISVPMPNDMAVNVFNEYKQNPETFQWPSNFAKYFPGIYVESNFGRGCIANIAASEMYMYYHYGYKTTTTENGATVTKYVQKKDSVAIYTTAPEALNSNNINFKISDKITKMANDGHNVLVSPGGYNVEIEFPILDIIKKYRNDNFDLAVINNLTLSIPASDIKNDYGLTAAPYLLMVPTNQMETFFAENQMPDGSTSFWATYSSSTGTYSFNSMRQYLVDMLQKEEITADDYTFTLVPVAISTETSSSSSSTTVVTSCVPYLTKPTMCELNLSDAKITFTYSRQVIN